MSSLDGPMRTAASILVVDDVAANLLALSAVLKPLGVRIVEARSGREAIEHVAREPFAVALLDVQMPEMDGFDTAAHIRKLHSNGSELPIIFLTAIHRDDNFVKKGYSAGGADYITKPFDADIVRARVRAFVKLFEQREDVRHAQVALRTQERDEAVRRLIAFERIATAALLTSELPVFLRELLSVFMSAAENADSAAILLREGNELRVHAAHGVNEEIDERYVVAMGESFAGTVAAERKPIELSNASTSTLVKSTWIRARGTKGLYGVPLLLHDEVLGVAHIGSLRVTSFSDTEKRLFGAMVERASVAVAEQLKRARLEELQIERTRLLELERTARVAAEVASRMKDEFIATVSHELRTPLNAILGWTVTARQKAPPDIDRALAIVERNALAQARMLEDVLDIARVASGKLRLHPIDISLNEIVEAALDAVRPAARAKNINVAVLIPDSTVLHADPQRFQQIIWNLLSNAIKFTPKDGRVEVEAVVSGDSVVIRVSDNGDGIDDAFLPHVFEPFRQADGSTTRRHGGLGLGLAIVKQIVDAHGGTITATSEGVGNGAKFIVEMPFGPSPDRVSNPPPAPSPASTQSPEIDVEDQMARLRGLKILVVDDDADARALLAQVFLERGAVVAESDSASSAFSELERFRPDVLVSDIAMPGGDGYGLIRAVRALPPDRGGRTPAVAVTAHARIVDGERAYAAGFQAHLSKPVDLMQLVLTIANLSRDRA